MLRELQNHIKISIQNTRKIAAKPHFAEIVQQFSWISWYISHWAVHLRLQNLGWFGLHAELQWVQEITSLSVRGDCLAEEGTICVLAWIGCTWRTCCSVAVSGLVKVSMPSAGRSSGKPGSSSYPPAAFTTAAAQLWIPKQQNPEQLHRFHVLISAAVFL